MVNYLQKVKFTVESMEKFSFHYFKFHLAKDLNRTRVHDFTNYNTVHIMKFVNRTKCTSCYTWSFLELNVVTIALEAADTFAQTEVKYS